MTSTFGNERSHFGTHCIQDTAKGPNVTLLIVNLTVYYSRTETRRRANYALSHFDVLAESFGNTKVPDLQAKITFQVNVFKIDVSVNDFLE